MSNHETILLPANISLPLPHISQYSVRQLYSFTVPSPWLTYVAGHTLLQHRTSLVSWCCQMSHLSMPSRPITITDSYKSRPILTQIDGLVLGRAVLMVDGELGRQVRVMQTELSKKYTSGWPGRWANDCWHQCSINSQKMNSWEEKYWCMWHR